jgi:hypothetical protein
MYLKRSEEYMNKVVVATLIALAYVTASASADLFVSPGGNDAAAGTATAPFKTLAKAKAAVRQMIPTATGPINVYVRAGTYYLDSTLTFSPEDGGSATAPITYSAFRGEKVIISGGIKVTSSWTTSSGNIQVTTIAPNLKVDQLFLNGKRQNLARYPNFDSTKILQGYSADATSASRASRWTNVTEGPGYVRGIHNNMWGGNDFIITGKDGSGNPQMQWVGDNNRGGGLQIDLRMVENIFEELDAPGEWYYKKPTGQLYFYPPTGTNLGSATIELATLETLIKVVGTASSKVKYLTFNRLTFTQTHRTLFTGKFEGLLRGDWCIVRTGTMFIQDAENVTVKHCFFDQIGGNGIFMNAFNKNHRVYDNEFTDVGATCVQTVGLQSAVRTPSTWTNQINTIQDNTPGPKTEDYPRDIVIDNNLMKKLGVFEKQTAGVNISMSARVTVRHNRITNSPRSAININDGTWGGHDIDYNDADDCVRETSDHGPFNSWGRDRFWSATKTVQTAALDAVEITYIHNNRFKGTNKDGYHTIDLDDGSSYYWIYNNLMFEAGIKLREGFRRKAYNNITVIGRQACHAWYGSCYDSIYRNIIVPSPSFTTGGNQNAYDVQAMTLSSGNQCFIDNNLFWNKSGGGVDYSPTKNAGMDAHSQVADPKFTNASAGDYTVAAGSPALTLGFVNFPMDSFGRMNVVPDTMQPVDVAVAASVRPMKTPESRCAWFGNRLMVEYSLPCAMRVSIALFSIDGRNLAVLEDGLENAGRHSVSLNPGSALAPSLSFNTYLVKMKIGEKMVARRIVVTK